MLQVAATILLVAAAAWGARAQSVTLPGRPDSLKFAVLGDRHAPNGAQDLEIPERMEAVRAKFPFEMVIIVGDVIQGNPEPGDFFDRFEKPFGPLIEAGVRFYAALGNHDNQSIRFYKPWNMAGERYYSFTRNGVQFFMLDTTRIAPPQVAWVEEALKNSQAEWKICLLHHPPYSDGKTHGSEIRVRAILEPIFVNYGVSVVFAGHDHVYERIKPQKGITYFVSGGGGPFRKGDVRPSEMTAAYFDQGRSFMILEIQGDDLFFQAISGAGKSLDSGVIHRRPKT